MSEEFGVLFSYLKRLRNRYTGLLSTWWLFDTMEILRAPNKVGDKKAEANVQVLNGYKGFFIPVREALRVHLFIEIAKFFDTSDQSVHTLKLITIAGGHTDRLSKKDFLEFHRDRKFLDELFAEYEAIKQEDINRLRLGFDKNKELLKKLKVYRDQYLAHDDKKKHEIKITIKEIKKMLKFIGEILDVFSLKLDFSSTTYALMESQTKRDTHLLFHVLKEHENKRRFRSRNRKNRR